MPGVLRVKVGDDWIDIAAGPAGPPGPPGPAAMQSQFWTWTGVQGEGVQSMAVLGDGQVATDAPPSQATTLIIAAYDQSGVLDWGRRFATMFAGDLIFLQYASDSSSWHLYRLTGTPWQDGPVWYLPVVTEDGSPPGTQPPIGEPVYIVPDPRISGSGGGGGGGEGFTFVQSTPKAVWTIDHPLSYMPNVTVVDSSGAQIEGDVSFPNGARVVVTFSAAFSGTAYLS